MKLLDSPFQQLDLLIRGGCIFDVDHSKMVSQVESI
jgi:hypothetical protein